MRHRSVRQMLHLRSKEKSKMHHICAYEVVFIAATQQNT